MRAATRAAIVARIAGQVFIQRDGETESHAVPVLEHVPQGQRPPYPYIRLGDGDVEPMDTDDSDGAAITTELEVFSLYAGSRQVSDIQDQLHALLHNLPLTITGANVILVTAEAGTIRDGEDGITREGTTVVRVLLDDISTSTL
jgi:hypothetical protein